MRWINFSRKKIITPDDLPFARKKQALKPGVPGHMLFQWHITERCNLRCAHCYQSSFSENDLPFESLLDILGGFKGLLAKFRDINPEVTAHITITGGEPFLRPDFFPLLEAIAADKSFNGFSILTNGTVITDAVAGRLASLNPVFIQVSLDGTEKTHDAVRGGGAFLEATKGIKALTESGIRTLISFTAQKSNYREFPEVARIGARLKVHRVWADRYIPFGRGKDLLSRVLNPDETRELIMMMDKARSTRSLSKLLQTDRTEVAMHRALQFLAANEQPYTCAAGRTLLAIEPNGDLLPCRRLPIVVGNVLKENLADIYFESPVLKNLRDRSKTIEGCKGCNYAELCRGGLRCLSYAMHSDFFRKDPGCWL